MQTNIFPFHFTRQTQPGITTEICIVFFNKSIYYIKAYIMSGVHIRHQIPKPTMRYLLMLKVIKKPNPF